MDRWRRPAQRCVVVEMLTTTAWFFRNRCERRWPILQRRKTGGRYHGNAHINCGDVGNDVVATAMNTSTAPEGFVEKPHFYLSQPRLN
jgi:hypothetical protein